jgi:hypothetical protein
MVIRQRTPSPPALSSKLERVPKNYTIVDQRLSITLSTRLLRGEGRGEGGVVRGERFFQVPELPDAVRNTLIY